MTGSEAKASNTESRVAARAAISRCDGVLR